MIDTIFFDVGGVILSKGWDRDSRHQASQQFVLDDGFERRHQAVLDAFERGQLSLDDYLKSVVFNMPRDFTAEVFKAYMYGCSTPMPESLQVLERLAWSRRFVVTTVNNESRELNDHRIQKFGLRRYFSTFFSSCYLHERKPHAEIYEMALAMTHRPAAECLFVDDTEENIVTAKTLGINTIHFTSAAQLESELQQRGML